MCLCPRHNVTLSFDGVQYQISIKGASLFALLWFVTLHCLLCLFCSLVCPSTLTCPKARTQTIVLNTRVSYNVEHIQPRHGFRTMWRSYSVGRAFGFRGSVGGGFRAIQSNESLQSATP
eukprot:2558768-Amphidinium_carterae.1